MIGRFLKAVPGAEIRLVSGVSEHHGRIFFRWHMIAPDGSVAINGYDFGRIGADGRLTEINGFFGDPPAI